MLTTATMLNYNARVCNALPYLRLSNIGVLAGLLCLALTACNNASTPTNTAPPAPPPPKVKITQAVTQDVTEWDDFTGRIAAVESVDVKARVSGYLDNVSFSAGSMVHKGDVLFQIDARPYQAQLDYAQAELGRAQTKQQLAQNDFMRAERLFQAKAISAEEHDARSKGLQETSAAVKSAQANVAIARLNVDYTTLRSPIDGRIDREFITVGNMVNANDSLLTQITKIDPVYVYIPADERSVLKYQRYLASSKTQTAAIPVRLALSDEQSFTHLGHLDFIAPNADANTGTVSLRAVFPNRDGLLQPGFFARVQIQATPTYSALLIPERAIASDQAQRFVWVVDDKQQVSYRKVELGARINGLRVIRAGLNANDWLVYEGLPRLKPGLTVDAERLPVSQ